MKEFAQISKILKETAENPGEKRHTVMIVDDNHTAIQALTEVLKGKFNLVVSSHWEDALEKLNSNVDLIILDIKMANMDGIELFERLKAKVPDVRIVFNSAYPGDSSRAKRVSQTSHDGYLTKGNYNPYEVFTLLEDLLVKS